MNVDQNPSDTSSNSDGARPKSNPKSNETTSSHSREMPSTSQEDLEDLPKSIISALTVKSSTQQHSEDILNRTSSNNITKWIVGLINVFSRSRFLGVNQDKASTSVLEPAYCESEENTNALKVYSRVSIRAEQESFPKQSSEQEATSSKGVQQVPEVTNLLQQNSSARRLSSTPIVEQPRMHVETRELYVSVTPMVESRSNTHLTPLGRTHSHEIVPNIPPSYSTVIKFPPPEQRRQFPRIHTDSEFSFSTRVPPPSYAQVQGVWTDSLSTRSSEDILYGPEPQYATCPNCTVVVVTDTRSTISKLTHFTAIGLCLLGCWPCCLIPYFMASCKDTYHHCPVCNHCFGVYSPW